MIFEEENNLIIAGGRDFNSYEVLDESIKIKYPELCECDNLIVYCGTAKGADTIGEEWAKENEVKIKYFRPDWNRLGKRAGIVRNKEMLEKATHLLCFWDGVSKGSKNMIEISIKKGIKVEVVLYKNIKKVSHIMRKGL